MSKKYPSEFRERMVAMVRLGLTPEALEKQFAPTARTIRYWLAQEDCDDDRQTGGLTTDERQELSRLRRENEQLKLEQEVLSKAAAWFAREVGAVPTRESDVAPLQSPYRKLGEIDAVLRHVPRGRSRTHFRKIDSANTANSAAPKKPVESASNPPPETGSSNLR